MARHVRSKSLAFAALVLTALCPVHDHAQTASVTYTYDKLGRVTAAIYGSGACVVYSYDANSNRTSQSNIVSGTPQASTWDTGVWGCAPWTP